MVDGMLGTRTRGGRMEGADESTELMRHLYSLLLFGPRIAKIYPDKEQFKVYFHSFDVKTFSIFYFDLISLYQLFTLLHKI